MTQLLYSKTIEQKINEIHNEVVNNDNILDALNLISIGIGFYNTFLNKQQISNSEIMSELRKQDNDYFEKIISLLNEIKGVKNDEQCNDAKHDDRK